MTHCVYCMQQLNTPSARFCSCCGKKQDVQLQPHQLPPGTILNHKYELGAVLGQGGFGITYVARDRTLDLRVAVKEFYPYGFVNRVNTVSSEVACLQDESKQSFFLRGKRRFLDEARVLAKFVGEPGIVDVRDFFEENNTVYIVMEFLDGVTLKQYLEDHGRLSTEETLRLLTPVMKSLQRLHRANVIHRDISPDNIMIVGNTVKLLDFGAARSVEDGDNKSFSVMLKRGYAPEEQYRSRGAQGPWTDVYALCATMYRCITGVRPEESPQRLRRDTLLPPSALGIAIAPHVERTLMRGLAVTAEQRIQTMDALLRGFTEKKPPELPPDDPKPNRRIILLLFLVTACLLVALIVLAVHLFSGVGEDPTHLQNDTVTTAETQTATEPAGKETTIKETETIIKAETTTAERIEETVTNPEIRTTRPLETTTKTEQVTVPPVEESPVSNNPFVQNPTGDFLPYLYALSTGHRGYKTTFSSQNTAAAELSKASGEFLSSYSDNGHAMVFFRDNDAYAAGSSFYDVYFTTNYGQTWKKYAERMTVGGGIVDIVTDGSSYWIGCFAPAAMNSSVRRLTENMTSFSESVVLLNYVKIEYPQAEDAQIQNMYYDAQRRLLIVETTSLYERDGALATLTVSLELNPDLTLHKSSIVNMG